MVRETLPGAEERAHAGWGVFNYYFNGELGYVGGQNGQGVLGLMRGAELDDAEGLLVATKRAKFMRQVRLSPGQPLPRAAIRALLLDAERRNLERGPPEREWRARKRR